MDFLPSFGNLAFTVAAFVVALSVIVAIHEFGHYIVGRWSGIKADVFSIGFGPVLASRTDRHGTKWQLAALPLGGYVKFRGDADAASAGRDSAAIDSLDPETRRETMHGAPLWARAATVAAGPVFNFVLSILVFAALVLVAGRAVDRPEVGRLLDLPAAMQTLQQGDVIRAVEGREVDTLSDLVEVARELEPAPTVTYEVERDGAVRSTEATFPLIPHVGSVTPQSAAMEAGLQEGDLIRSVEGQPVRSFEQLRDLVDASEGAALTLGIWRSGDTLEVTLSPRQMDLPRAEGGFETRYLIGISVSNGGLFFEPPTRRAGLGEAAAYGVDQTLFIIRSSLSGLWHIITGAISSCNLQGPIGIAETSSAAASAGVDNFIYFIAVLSTAVGLLNLFPIPVLDGGHLMFHAYEAVTGQPPSDRALRVFMSIGLTLMLSLMLFALTNDLFC